MVELHVAERNSDTIRAARLAIGFAQGVAAWMLFDLAERSWSADHAALFSTLVLLAAFPPLIVLTGLGTLRNRTLIVWTLAASALLAGLAVYDVWREPLARGYSPQPRRWPSAELAVFSAAALYVAHHLIEPADVERRWWASYPARFEGAWRHGFQLGLSITFTVVFWGVLLLGAALFDLIGVKALSTLLRQRWFISPALATAFAGAVHLTDVRPALIRGVRTVGLTLLAWLLPLMTGLATAFLLALLFTGLAPLWATRHASWLLFSAAATLIVLLNAAYQDGGDHAARSPIIRGSGRIAALLLAPFAALAGWADWVRVAQYGLTPERTTGLAVLAAGAIYALGYAWAALSRGAWMKPLERVNVVAAVLIVAEILALLSPLADPARLSATQQVARLQGGRTTAPRFDFAFLRFDAGRFGREALAGLARASDPAVAKGATAALQLKGKPFPSQTVASTGPAFGHAVLHGASPLPENFRRQVWSWSEAYGARCLIDASPCDLFVRDIDHDGSPEVLILADGDIAAYRLQGSGSWARIGGFHNAACPGVAEGFRRGDIGEAPASVDDLQIGGEHLPFQSATGCRTPAPQPKVEPVPPSPPPALGPAFGS